MAETREQIEYTSMRIPKDVAQMIGELAAMNGTSMHEWNDTELRKFVAKKLRERVAKRAVELGESGA